MAKLTEEGWPEVELPAPQPLTKEERKEHRQSLFILFGGSTVGYVLLAYIVGAPPLRNAVAKTWSGMLALMQLLW